MFNLYQIVAAAQGGQGLDNLASRFGLSRDQADAAVKSLVPALSTAFMAKSAQPGGLGEIAGAMGDDGHRQAYADPAAAQDPSLRQKGGAVAGSIFGGDAIVGQVVAQASRYTGIPAATLEQMLPVVTSMVLGGVASAMHGQGLGGILGQLAGGGAFGPFGAGAGQAGTVPGGSFGGMVGEIVSGMFGAGRQGQAAGPAGGATGGAAPGVGLPPMMQAGMDALARMFQPGVPPQPGQPASQPGGGLADEIGSILNGKRG